MGSSYGTIMVAIEQEPFATCSSSQGYAHRKTVGILIISPNSLQKSEAKA